MNYFFKKITTAIITISVLVVIIVGLLPRTVHASSMGCGTSVVRDANGGIEYALVSISYDPPVKPSKLVVAMLDATVTDAAGNNSTWIIGTKKTAPRDNEFKTTFDINDATGFRDGRKYRVITFDPKNDSATKLTDFGQIGDGCGFTNNKVIPATSDGPGLLPYKHNVGAAIVASIFAGATAPNCSTLDEDNVDYCCNTTNNGDSNQCKLYIADGGKRGGNPAATTLLPYDKGEGSEMYDSDPTPGQCQKLTAGNVDLCCNITDFGDINECKKYIADGGVRTPRSRGSINLDIARNCLKNIGGPFTNDNADINKTNNAGLCCSSVQLSNILQCQDYRQKNGAGGGAIVAGTQIVDAQITDGFLGGGSAAAAQASSVELQKCNAIKFISALDIVMWLKCIIVSAIIPFIFALAFVTFLWGVFKFMTSDEKTKREAAKNYILFGMLGLFIMVSLWGILAILGRTIGIGLVVPVLKTDYLSAPPTAKKK